MTRIKVQFEVEIPEEATDDQIQGWLEFELWLNCTLNGKNPMQNLALQAVEGSLEWEGVTP